MSNVAHALEPRLRAVAQALYDKRRELMDADSCDLDELSDGDFYKFVELARAGIAAADKALVDQPPARLCEVYVDTIRLDLGAGTLLVLVRNRGGEPSGALSAAGAGFTMIGAVVAQHLWSAVAGRIRDMAFAPEPPSPEQQEPTP